MQAKSLLKYRYGFLAHTTNVPALASEALEGWSRSIVGRLVVHAHPETQILTVKGTERSLVVIGLMYPVTEQDMHAALEALAADANRSCPEFLLQVSGRFAMIVLEGDETYVYHDAFGSRSIFYSLSHPGYVASHGGLLAEVTGAQKDQHVVDFLGCEEYNARTVKYLPGDQSLWKDIYALIPNNRLHLESTACVRYWPVRPKAAVTFEQFSTVYDSHIKGLISAIANRFVLVGITGGIDTRAVFAAMRKYRLDFSGVTWTGGYVQEKELAPINEIVALLGIEHVYVDTKRKFDQDLARIASINSGSVRDPSRLTALMHADYGDKSGVAVRGYGGEILRGFYNISRSPMLDLSTASMAKAYGSSIKKDKVTPSREYLDYVEGMFAGFRKRANYADLEHFGYDPSDIFYWEHRMGIWASGMLNESDPALFTMVGLNGRALYEAGFGLQNEERLNKGLLAKIVEKYSPELAAIRYF